LRKVSTAIKILLSVAILLFLFRKANLSQSVHYLSKLGYPFVALSLALIVTGQVVRAQRLAVMLFGAPRRETLWRVLRIQMVSFLPGAISPAKVGEVAKVYMLETEMDVPMARGLACFVTERVLDLLLLTPLAGLGLYVLFRAGLQVRLSAGWTHLAIVALIAIAGALAAGFVWARARGVTPAELWRSISPRGIISASVLTLLYWGIVFLEVWCFCKAAAFDARVWHVALVVPTALLSSLIPISFSGFGLREAVMIGLFQRPPIGSGYEQAFLVSIMYDILGLGVPALMGVLFWLAGRKNGSAQA
jgi:uncharacterized membrane protein YbhN (UPF0104 family)